jgi:hypothetical protein
VVAKYSSDCWMVYTAVVVLYHQVWATVTMSVGHCWSRVVNGVLGLQGDLPLYPLHEGFREGWHSFRSFFKDLALLGCDEDPALEDSALCLSGGEAGRYPLVGLSNITIKKKNWDCLQERRVRKKKVIPMEAEDGWELSCESSWDQWWGLCPPYRWTAETGWHTPVWTVRHKAMLC